MQVKKTLSLDHLIETWHLHPVARASQGSPRWNFHGLQGTFTELSGLGSVSTLSCAFSLVKDAQQQGEPTAWVTTPASSFYPPDLCAGEIDLDSLVVVRVEPCHLPRAADHLLRSGAFGLVVVDWVDTQASLPVSVQTRWAGLTQRHHSMVLCLTRKQREVSSLSSLVMVRGDARRVSPEPGKFLCQVHVIKDKRHGPGWKFEEDCHGPDGLC